MLSASKNGICINTPSRYTAIKAIVTKSFLRNTGFVLVGVITWSLLVIFCHDSFKGSRGFVHPQKRFFNLD